MKPFNILLAVASLGLLAACNPDARQADNKEQGAMQGQEQWVQTTGTITESARMPDGIYAYTLEYVVTGGTALNADGVLIQGPLEQHIFNAPGLAVSGQQFKLQYSSEEPMFYKLLEDIVFEE